MDVSSTTEIDACLLSFQLCVAITIYIRSCTLLTGVSRHQKNPDQTSTSDLYAAFSDLNDEV